MVTGVPPMYGTAVICIGDDHPARLGTSVCKLPPWIVKAPPSSQVGAIGRVNTVAPPSGA